MRSPDQQFEMFRFAQHDSQSVSTVQRFNESLLNHIDVAFHVKVRFGNFVMGSIENFFEAAHGLVDRHILAFGASEYFRHVKRLAEEALDFSGALNGQFIFGT